VEGQRGALCSSRIWVSFTALAVGPTHKRSRGTPDFFHTNFFIFLFFFMRADFFFDIFLFKPMHGDDSYRGREFEATNKYMELHYL